MKRFQALDRRAFLRGAGVAMSLPLLDGMQPLVAAADASAGRAAPVRLAWVFIPNGANYARWKPEGVGRDWKLSPTLEALAPVRDEVQVLSGLAQLNARSLGDGAGDHARSAAAFLTGAHPNKTHGAGIRAGISADQVAAQQIGRETRLPSIELGTERGRAAGACDSGYACAYSNTIAWHSPTQPAAKEINPRLAFERLFGAGDRGGDDRARRLARQQSVLDLVADQARGLHARLGREDRRKLDEYFHSVREVERRVEHQATLADEPVEGDPIARQPPTAEPANPTEHIRLMYDLMLLAFQTDATRVATFMVANEGSDRHFPEIGVNSSHHQLSHHQNVGEKLEKIARIDRFYAEQFGYFVRRLRDTPEGDGTLLDHCAVLYGGAISDGNRHDHHDLPIVLAGRGGGAFEPGRHRQFARETPLCNAFLSMFDAAGVEAARFGDSTGRLAGLDT